MPEMDGLDSDDMMEDGYIESPASSYAEQSLDEDEDSASDASDLESSPEVVRRRYRVSRANMHDEHMHRREVQEAEQR